MTPQKKILEPPLIHIDIKNVYHLILKHNLNIYLVTRATEVIYYTKWIQNFIKVK